MSKYTTYLQNEIVKIKIELDTYAGDRQIEPLFVAQLKDFEDSLKNSIEADKLNAQADEAIEAGKSELAFELSKAARTLIKL